MNSGSIKREFLEQESSSWTISKADTAICEVCLSLFLLDSFKS